MLLSDQNKSTIKITGDYETILLEFFGLFDNLFDDMPEEYQVHMLHFILDKATGKFDKEFPKND